MKSLLTIIVAWMLASTFSSQVLAQWTTVQHSGIPGPALFEESIVFAPINENICWGVTRNGHHVIRTTNGGTTWTSSVVGSPSFLGGIAARNATTAWVTLDNGLLCTTDAGVSWTRQLTAGVILGVQFFDDSTGVCFGQQDGGYFQIFTTTNGGTLWTRVSRSNIPDPINSSEGPIPANSWVVGNTIWVPTNAGFDPNRGGSLYKSTDRGRTWSAVRDVVSRGGFFCAFKDSLNGLLSGAGAQSATAKKTTDGGTTWTPTRSIPQGMTTLFMSYIPGTSGSYMITALPPRGPLPGSAYTRDNGATWTVVDHLPHGKAAFVSPNVGWSSSTPDTIYKWTGDLLDPSVEWTSQSSGIPTGDQVVLAAVDENVCWGVTRATGARWVTRTTNGGTNWIASSHDSLNDFFGVAALNADTAWIAATGGIYKTTNGGVSWTQQLATGMLIIHFFDSNKGVCIGGDFPGPIQVYTTTDRGSVWIQVSSIPSAAGGAIPSNYAAVGNTLWCPTNGGSLYKTTDRGLTWSATPNVVGTSGGVFVAFKDVANGLATANNTVFRTTDGGANWTSTGVPDRVSAFLPSYIPGTPGSYMITSNPYPLPTRLNGSAYTLNNATAWTTVDTLAHGWARFVSSSVGWSWGGANVIYKWNGPPIKPPTSVKQTYEVAEGFRLEQNYPNPFNPSTRIKFQIPNTNFVSLKVFDVLGREVRTLVNEELKAGSYETTFDARELSSGVYFYTLDARGFVQTKKLLLLR